MIRTAIISLIAIVLMAVSSCSNEPPEGPISKTTETLCSSTWYQSWDRSYETYTFTTDGRCYINYYESAKLVPGALTYDDYEENTYATWRWKDDDELDIVLTINDDVEELKEVRVDKNLISFYLRDEIKVVLSASSLLAIDAEKEKRSCNKLCVTEWLLECGFSQNNKWYYSDYYMKFNSDYSANIYIENYLPDGTNKTTEQYNCRWEWAKTDCTAINLLGGIHFFMELNSLDFKDNLVECRYINKRYEMNPSGR